MAILAVRKPKYDKNAGQWEIWYLLHKEWASIKINDKKTAWKIYGELHHGMKESRKKERGYDAHPSKDRDSNQVALCPLS